MVERQEKAQKGNVSTKQKRFLSALMIAPTITAAAKMAGVGERTAHTWLADPLFRAALTSAEREALTSASRQLTAALTSAVDKLQSLITDQDAGATVNLRAAVAVVEQVLKLREILDFEERLTALEAKANER